MGLLRLRYSKDIINCYHPKDEYGFSDLLKHKHSIVYTSLKDFQEIIIDGVSFTFLPLKHSKKCYGYFIKSKTTQFVSLNSLKFCVRNRVVFYYKIYIFIPSTAYIY
jgi:phosphoribosyl 1,2-cyclic phosphate phosphodiesterase